MGDLVVRNVAFIDGQNLHYSFREDGFVLDYRKFRVYLREKYGVVQAYYHFGFKEKKNDALYAKLQDVGFITVFRNKNPRDSLRASAKKGNVDTDIIFEMMNRLYNAPDSFGKAVLVSGDGDFFKVVAHYIEKGRFEKVLFPSLRRASSLYKKLGAEYFDTLENDNIRPLITRKKITKK